MKFIQRSEGEWSAYQTPFSFWLSVDPGSVDIAWNYSGSTGNETVSDLETAIDWCHEFALEQTLDQLQRIAPAGARTAETDGGWGFLCNGCDKDMGYSCALPPGHSGQCYSTNKRVWFNHQ